jgi:hypothetical protein
LAVAEDLGVEHDVVLYMKEPPDRAALEKMVKGLEDPVEDLVRKDSKFKKMGLNPDDYVDNPEAVIAEGTSSTANRCEGSQDHYRQAEGSHPRVSELRGSHHHEPEGT